MPGLCCRALTTNICRLTIKVSSSNARHGYTCGGLLPDPGVLVFQRPGTLVTQFAGFADRDMVAQAAVNAIPPK